MSSVLKHTCDFRVRYADTDTMGVVYNGNYFSFFETGRTELLRSKGLPYTEVEDKGFMLPLVDCYAKFINPAKFDDLLEITAVLEFENKPVIQINYNIDLKGKPIATGYTRHVFVKKGSMKPVRPPQLFIDLFESN